MGSTHGDGRRRRIVAATAVTAAGLLLWPGTAYAADVTITPTEARQGDAVRLEFTVPAERAGTTTKQIEVRLPADAPVAEVYPMSVDGWAPRISSRTLDKPLAGIHSSGVSTVTTAVTWVRVGAGDAGSARLALSMGPMPQAERLTFEVVQTYADGTVVRWADAAGAQRAPALTLLPAAPGAAGPAAHGGGHGAPPAGAPAAGGNGADGNPGGGVDGDPATRAGGAGEESGNADGMLAAGLLAGLGGGAAIGWLVSRWRRRGPDEATALAEVTGDPDQGTKRDDAATLAEITGRAEPTATRGSAEPTATRGGAEPTATRGSAEPTATRGSAEPTATRGSAEPTATRGSASDATTPAETIGNAAEPAEPADPTRTNPQPADPQPAVSAASR
ncbi:DUF1775 domain-containing protein [Micromonospora sp. C97]|uniref:DUF1775 domain-containing protein n=1 Tax=Micromonospora sp. C97 TaxID=2824883 RepID=UPI001B37AE1D|nr:DUF1775 domain-containing protein [Micromonospora sp. C97]MBQ1034550.1 DUF1775 domain-containing protein [Micromonospora sp. C97]